ncbi:hypothetical protein [Pseudomonas tussilaginis]|uniref:hypothetical protein n=1 Tax=Pseudomonas putida TaxID=303 RepID=UPI002364387C|nr:hypothetical protein [Pseudomonas putida]MDD1976823.1 hypothetical protein [Pseudomonas putida]
MRLLVAKTSILNVLFVLFFCFSVVSYTYEVQNRAEWVTGLLIVRWGLGFAFCLMCLCFSRNCIPYILLFGIGVAVSIFGEKEHLSYFAIILFSYAVADQNYISIKAFFQKAAFSVFFTICLVFALAFFDIIERKVFVNTLGFAFEVRDGFGFYNPNPASLLLLSCVLVFLALDKKFMFFLCMFVFWLCQIWLGSRTYIAVSVMVFLLYFFCGRANLLKLGAMLLMAIVAMFPLLVAWVTNTEDFHVGEVDVNALLSDRLSVMRQSFDGVGGVNYFPSLDFITIDPGFINLLGYMGVLFYCVFLVVVMITLFKIRHGREVIVVIAFVLSNFTENAISPYNLLSLLFFVLIFKALKGKVMTLSEVKSENYRF